MSDVDIKKLCTILTSKKRHDLVDMLSNSTSYLEESSTYGSRAFSTLSTFYLKYHPNKQYEIDNLPQTDKEEIFKAVRLIYPLQDNEPEITEIIYYPDFDMDIVNLVETKELDRISFDYIHEQIKKCHSKIEIADYDGAVTNARNLIESICLFILESKTKQKYNYDGNLIKLYRNIALILKMMPNDCRDENLKQILSGIFSIINGVSGLRNIFSDSHGSSPSMSMRKIDVKHATLTVNLAKSLTEYLFLSYEENYNKENNSK